MSPKQYVLYEPGGQKIRGYDNGQLVETRYIEVVPTEIKSPDRDSFLESLAAMPRVDLEYCRVGYVDDNGVGVYCAALGFLDGTETVP